MNTTTTTEQQLLELAAQAIGFGYQLYVRGSYHLRGGLLYRSSDGRRTKVWDPLTDDADLLQLAAAAPAISLQDIIVEAARIGGDDAVRRTYVREQFVRAVTQNTLPMRETVVTVINNDNDNDNATPTP